MVRSKKDYEPHSDSHKGSDIPLIAEGVYVFKLIAAEEGRDGYGNDQWKVFGILRDELQLDNPRTYTGYIRVYDGEIINRFFNACGCDPMAVPEFDYDPSHFVGLFFAAKVLHSKRGKYTYANIKYLHEVYSRKENDKYNIQNQLIPGGNDTASQYPPEVAQPTETFPDDDIPF